jgi:LAGLIDADG DNA endonuclease family protein
MGSDNPTGGDDQQGRPRCSLTPDYVAGFIDGEGCFSVSIHPHPTVRYGRRWLVAPCFQAYQHRDNSEILEALRGFFGCGRITPKGPNSSVMTYSVYRRSDLESVIVPFFEHHPLLSRKQEDFLKFREIVRLMKRKLHRTDDGFRRIVELAFSMNQRGKQRRYRIEEVLAEPSETARQARLGEPAKIQSDPHGDMGRTAEMTVPPLEIVLGLGDSRGGNSDA